MSKSENFETKLEKAKELLDKLSDPSITLEESVNYYKSGIKLLKEASKMLESAKLEFDVLNKEENQW